MTDVLAEELRPLLAWAEAVSQHHAMLRTEPPFTTTQALKEALASAYAALVRTPETLDVDALVASLPAVRRRTDVQPMIPESAVRRLLTTLAAAQSPAPPEGLRATLEAHTPQVRSGPFIVCSCGWEHDDGEGDQWREHVLAASPAPDPGAGLREAAQEVLDIIDTATREGDDTTPLYDFLSEGAARSVELLRAALAPSAEPPETT